MTYTTLKAFVDDILLLARNNNISESEDLSREQIRQWIKAYKHQIIRDRIDKWKQDDGENLEDVIDGIYIREKGPLELTTVSSYDQNQIFTKKLVKKLEGIFDNTESSILAVHDQAGENIQIMNHIRRHYNYFRKYTGGEPTASYEDGYVYVTGPKTYDQLKYIWVLAIYEDNDDNFDTATSEDDVRIPSWMVPPIKQLILRNELAFMLNRPSDDSNNSTLASVKPHGPQDDEE